MGTGVVGTRAGVVAGIVAGLGTSAWAQPASLYRVGVADGFQSYASGVSPDGRYVCGVIQRFSGVVAYRWSVQDGMILVDPVDGWPMGSTAGGVSESGVLSCSGIYSPAPGAIEAFRWSPDTGIVRLGDLQQASVSSAASGISGDGSILVGSGTNGGQFATIWTENGIESLGDFAGGVTDSYASGVSDDGRVVVGYGTNAQGRIAFRWTREGGVEPLGDLPGGPVYSVAYDASADGSVIVGTSKADADATAFRWTRETGMVNLGTIENGIADDSFAYAVNDDGSVIVGYSQAPRDGGGAFYWTARDGMRRLTDVLRDRHVDAAELGWESLDEAHDISADGTVIVGYGRRNGYSEAFVAVVPREACPADFNHDQFVDFFDYSDYVGCFETGICPPGVDADFNYDHFVDFFDYADFVDAFEAGC